MEPAVARGQTGSAQGVGFLAHPVRPRSAPTYWRCEPGWSWHARPLPDHLLWYVLDGIGRLTLDGRDTDLGPGTAVVFAPGDAPVAHHDPRRRLLVFGMHFDATGLGTLRCVVRDPELVAALARRCDAGHRRGDPLGARQSRLCLEQILCVLWEDATDPVPGPVDAVLDEITAAIRQDPSRRWSVAELAARAGLSRAQFTRRFTAHARMPPNRYLIHARVERARHLLTETSMSVTQVAATLGYPDVAYFSRQYRRQTGRSPRQAREPSP
jgi:AraC-like DNA-binding protein